MSDLVTVIGIGIVLGQKSSLAMQPFAQQQPLLNHGTASYLNKKRSIPEASRKKRMARVYTLESSWNEGSRDKFC